MRRARTLCCAVAPALVLAPAVRADEHNRQTFLTFSGPAFAAAPRFARIIAGPVGQVGRVGQVGSEPT